MFFQTCLRTIGRLRIRKPRTKFSAFASFDAAGYLEANADVAAAVTAGVFIGTGPLYRFWSKRKPRWFRCFGYSDSYAWFYHDARVVDQVAGGALNDAIFGAITAAATTTTLNAGDNIDGGAGTDTPNLTLSGGNYVGDATITNVEQFSITASGGGRSFDATAWMDDEAINFRPAQNLTVTNMEFWLRRQLV